MAKGFSSDAVATNFVHGQSQPNDSWEAYHQARSHSSLGQDGQETRTAVAWKIAT